MDSDPSADGGPPSTPSERNTDTTAVSGPLGATNDTESLPLPPYPSDLGPPALHVARQMRDVLEFSRRAHESGDVEAGLDVYSGDVVNTLDAGVVEPAHAKRQAISSAAEAANLVLKIDDIISAGDLSTEGEEEPGGPGGGMGGGMGGMGGGMGGMM